MGLHRRSKSIFMDDLPSDDEPDAESAIDLLIPSSNASVVPGDLQLSGQITRLEARITELKQQDALLDGLIRQAELTGNAKELKLLNRSQSSLRRELRTAELEVAQYRRQEEENRLVPGRTRGTIPHAVTEGQVVRYTLEIAQTQDERVVLAWHVTHRYSEFWELDRALRDDPSLGEAMRHVTDLPGKRLVPLTNAGFVESRRAGLEKYIQSLLAERALCDSPLVRSFLSQRPQQPRSAGSALAPTRLVQTLYRTVASGFEEGSVPPMLDLMTQGLSRQLAEVAGGVQGVTDELAGLMPVLRPWARGEASTTAPAATGTSTATATATTVTGDSDADAAAALEDALPPALQALGGEGAPGGFTAPICDLFIEVFDLKESNWLRRQAIVIILQQVLGGTIERKMRDNFRRYTTPRKVDRVLRIFQDAMWPGGEKRPDSPPRTDVERLDARMTSSRRLGMLIPDVAANMIGRGNARRAAQLVWGALQDRRLNQHLVLCMFDEIFGAMFPM
jgi:sorting nexin-25